MSPFFGFIGPAFQSQNVSLASEDLCNLYPEKNEGGQGPSPYYLYNVPGLTHFATLPNGPVRALFGGNNRLFAVGGSHLYEVLPNGSTSDFGAMASASGPAQIVVTPFGTSAAVVVWDGTSGANDNVWVFDGLNPPTAVISAVGIGYIDGYAVALRPPSPPGDPNGTVPINTLDGTQLNLSDLLNPFSWDPLQYAIRSGNSDQVQMIYTPGSSGGPGPEELWWFGKRTTEVWYNTGGSSLNPFPFQRVPGAFINLGLWAKNSIAAVGHSLFFLSGDDRGVGVVIKMNGYIPQRVSTHAVEAAMQSYAVAGSDLSDAIAYAYQENGHEFYVLNFPTANKTWVYDVTENLWHRRSGTGSTSTAQTGFYHAWTLGAHFLGDQSNGNIYVASPNVYQDNGSPKTFQRTAPHLYREHQWTKYSTFELAYGGPFTTARTFNLEISRDGGFNYETARPVTTGTGGQSPDRAIWRQLGRARDMVLRVTTTDNAQQAWLDGFIKFDEGTGM